VKTKQAFAAIALGFLLVGCEDGPTVPELGAGPTVETGESGIAAALDQGAAQAQALVEESLAHMPDGDLPEGGARRPGPDATDRRADDRRPRRDVRAELAVALGAESVAMAERLLEGTDPTAEQLRHLDHARSLLRRAEAALEEGREAAAIELAQAAQISALKAVVLPRVTKEEARALHDLAHDLLRQAREAVATDPTEVERHLLQLAERLFEVGTARLENGVVRGVVQLWKSAALSSFLIG
jgi:HEPN domain-containing protein